MLAASIETYRRSTQVILRTADVILEGNWEACHRKSRLQCSNRLPKNASISYVLRCLQDTRFLIQLKGKIRNILASNALGAVVHLSHHLESSDLETQAFRVL